MSQKEEDKKKPKIDFESISKDIAKRDEKQHIDQLGPAITETYIKHSKYTDGKGVVRYKQKFSKEEAEKLANDVYDTLAYHSHRRVFGMDEKQYEALKQFKDPNGNPYVDTVTQYHFKIDRDSLKRILGRDDKDNNISHKALEKILEDSVEHHAGLLTSGIISKHGLNNPEHMDTVKKAIDDIVDKYKLSKKLYNTKKIHDHQQLLNMYVQLSSQHYRED